MISFKRAELQAFLDLTEGEPPPVFVGRETILKTIETEACKAWKGPTAARHGRPKKTLVVQGAPGAGKTSLLHELQRRTVANTTSGSLRVLILNSSTISNPIDILKPLAQMIHQEMAPDFLARYARSRSGGIQAGLAGSGFTAGWANTTNRADPSPDLMAFRDWVDSLPSDEGLAGPVLIAIDEAQRFREGPETPLAKLLQGLHDMNPKEGPGLPFMLVAAGLGDTVQRLVDMDLTRGDPLLAVGAFGPGEVQVALSRFCAHCGLDHRPVMDKLLALAETCEGWPRHLHFALAAVGAAALETDGDLARIDWAKVTAATAASRRAYYVRLQSDKMGNAYALVAAVMRAFQDGQRKADVVNSIDRLSRPGAAEWQIPKGLEDGWDFVDHLIHCGALHEGEDKRLSCPIPSFRTYLLEAGS